MLPLTKKDLKSYQDATEYYICKKKKKIIKSMKS